MRLEEHVIKERRPVYLWKGGELYFLKIVEDGGVYRTALWVWDTYPGELYKGLPVYISEYAGKYLTVKAAIDHFKLRGFKVQHTPHKVPQWIRRNNIEEKLSEFMENN